jgi:diphthine synthase
MTAEISDSLNLPDCGLILIGMGPGKFSAMTIEAIQAAKQCDSLRYEAYTALWPQDELDLLEAECGEITKVMRPEIESPELLFELAKNSLVGLLVVGDPLQATTHVDLQLQAAEAGIECITFHGISITTIVTGALGLSNYKFGRQTTLTYPYGGWVATSPLEVLAQNYHLNLHTLALLDLDPTGAGTGDQRPMKPEDAVNSLVMMFTKLQDSTEDMQGDNSLENMRIEACKQYLQIPIEQRIVVLCSDMGCSNEQIITTTVGQLSQHQGGRLNCLVFPSNMSDVEEAALLRWK